MRRLGVGGEINGSIQQSIGYVSLVMRDYEEAIDFHLGRERLC